MSCKYTKLIELYLADFVVYYCVHLTRDTTNLYKKLAALQMQYNSRVSFMCQNLSILTYLCMKIDRKAMGREGVATGVTNCQRNKLTASFEWNRQFYSMKIKYWKCRIKQKFSQLM